MSSINVSEKDFLTVAHAARDAMDAENQEQAVALDKIARKINAALTSSHDSLRIAGLMGMRRSSVRWQDMPSTLEDS
jgi:hypothetical protein